MHDTGPGNIGPYQVLGSLGSGGMGDVYHARDTRLERDVAVKLLSERLTHNPQAVARFVREARAVSALNHPNIVTIFDAGESNGRRFIVMEYVKGKTLRALVSRLTVSKLIEVAAQIARALEAAHAAGIVHRDIKPDNIMIRDDGYVKVVDFGIARLLRDWVSAESATMAVTGPDIVLGTPRYMSPEQVRNDTLTSASDIFSLGVVLYESAVGRHPFAAESAVDMVLAITSATPLPASRVNPEIPKSFGDVIDQMLQKDPSRRPGAVEIVQRLTHDMTPAAIVRPRVAPTSVGRARERTELRAALDAAISGRSIMVGLVGEAGIGKTTLAEDLLRDLATDGVPCYVGRGLCSERLAGSEAYLPWLEALDSLLQGEGHETVYRLMRTLAPTWCLQLTVASDTTSARLDDRKAGSPERFKRELLVFLEELSRLRPVVLFFEDLHWSDASTVDLLAYLAARFDRIRVLVLATYRPAELQLAKHPFVPLRLDLQARNLVREIALDFLNHNDIAEYVAREFPGHRFPEELLALVRDKTEGNPLFMVALLRDLRDRGEIVRDPTWTVARPVSEIGRELPGSIRSLIERKLSELEDGDRQLLVAASVQGARFDAAVLSRALDIEAAALEDRLEMLERVHMFVQLAGEESLPDGTQSSQYRFVHVLYQNCLYQSLRPARRAALSGAIARAMTAFYGRDEAAVATELAFLFEAARDFKSAARYFLMAVRRAADVFADHEVIRLAGRGLDIVRMLPENGERAQLELDLQLALGLSLTAAQGYAAPEVERAYTRARALCQQVSDSSRLFLALQGLWRFYSVKGDLRTAAPIPEQLLALAPGTGDDQFVPIAHQAFSAPLILRGHFAEALAHMDRALELHDEAQYPRIVRLIGSDLGMAALMWSSLCGWLLGYADDAARRVDAGIARACKVQHPLSQAFAHNFASWVGHYRREPSTAQTHAEAALAIAMEHGLKQWVPVAFVLRGWSLAEQGHVADGIAELRRGLHILEQSGAEMNRPHFLSMLAQAHLKEGRPDEGLLVLNRAFGFVEKNEDCYWLPELLRLKGVLLQEAEPRSDEKSEHCFREAIATARRLDAKLLELRATTSLSRLRIRQHRCAECPAELGAIYSWFTEGLNTPDLREARTVLTDLGTAAG